MTWVRAVAVTLWLGPLASACGSPQVATATETFALAVPYQQAYRNFRTYAKACHESQMIGGSVQVDAEIYSDLRRAEVKISIVGIAGPVLLMRADFEGVDDTKSRMVMTRPRPDGGMGVTTLVAGANGSTQC